jgi:hypothetical protein
MLFVSESYFEKFFDVKFGIEAAFTLCVWTMIIVSTNVVVHNKCQNAFIFFILWHNVESRNIVIFGFTKELMD